MIFLSHVQQVQWLTSEACSGSLLKPDVPVCCWIEQNKLYCNIRSILIINLHEYTLCDSVARNTI